MDNYEDELLDNIITLNDEAGNEEDFEILDYIEYEDKDYVALLPVDESADSVVIMQVDALDDDTASFFGVEDENILYAVFEIFKEHYKDFFEFED